MALSTELVRREGRDAMAAPMYRRAGAAFLVSVVALVMTAVPALARDGAPNPSSGTTSATTAAPNPTTPPGLVPAVGGSAAGPFVAVGGHDGRFARITVGVLLGGVIALLATSLLVARSSRDRGGFTIVRTTRSGLTVRARVTSRSAA
jgi:hypothetical protein